MGFGILLIGYAVAYFITMGLGMYAFAGLIIGHFIMYMGISELKKYSPAFIYAYIMSILLIVTSIFECVSGLDLMLGFGLNISESVISDYAYALRFLLDALFNVALLYGIADISMRVDYPDTKYKAYSNMIFVGVYNIFQIGVSLFANNPSDEFKKFSSFIMTVVLLMKLVYVVLNLWLIFKCYAFICPSDDVDMKRKPSRFEFVNNMRKKSDEKEEKAIKETQEYMQKRADAKKEKARLKEEAKKNRYKKK